MDIESIILGISYLGIFIMMITNGIFSFPSSQFLYIIVGYFIGRGYLTLEYSIIAGTIGNTIGNIALYEITREHGPKAALKFLPEADRHLEKAQKFFSKKGTIFLFLAKLLPALKVFVPVLGGVAKTPRAIYIPLIIVSSAIWATGFISLGYYFGKSMDVYKAYLPILLFIAILLVIFLIVSYNKTSMKEK